MAVAGRSDDQLQRKFTREEFNRLVELGVFADDDRSIELLHGRLIVVPPQGPEHASTSTDFSQLVRAAYADRAHVREEKPLACGPEDQPEPDLAVIVGSPLDYKTRHPRGDEALLVVEVSKTSQARDHDKASIYASARVPEYWLVDLDKRRVEVHTKPDEDCYALVRVARADEELELPGTSARIPLARLFG